MTINKKNPQHFMVLDSDYGEGKFHFGRTSTIVSSFLLCLKGEITRINLCQLIARSIVLKDCKYMCLL